jgi:hypothetical protein
METGAFKNDLGDLSALSKEELLREMGEMDFAAKDMIEYLDSRSKDKAALAAFKEICRRRAALKSVYSEKFAPLLATDITVADSWQWGEEDFPWDD